MKTARPVNIFRQSCPEHRGAAVVDPGKLHWVLDSFAERQVQAQRRDPVGIPPRILRASSHSSATLVTPGQAQDVDDQVPQ